MSGETLKTVVINAPTVIATPRDSNQNSKEHDVALKRH